MFIKNYAFFLVHLVTLKKKHFFCVIIVKIRCYNFYLSYFLDYFSNYAY